MNRRGFLTGILAAGVAPAAVGSGILMSVRKLVVPGGVIGYDFGSKDEFALLVRHGNRLYRAGQGDMIELGRVDAGEDLREAAKRQLAAYQDRLMFEALQRAGWSVP